MLTSPKPTQARVFSPKMIAEEDEDEGEIQRASNEQSGAFNLNRPSF